MKLSENAEKALAAVVAKFVAGDLSPIVEIARIQPQGGMPSEKWTLSNRVLAYIQTGDLDCRGFRQWQSVGRYVKPGSHAAFILAPILIPYTDPDTGEERVTLKGFKAVAVFGVDDTEGKDLPKVDYAPRELPPLANVAKRLGVRVDYMPLPSDRLGSCATDGSRIRLGSQDPQVFFHELAHAAQSRIDGKLKGGQDAGQEVVAELSAAVLSQLYGFDRTGNAWSYIAAYADPLPAIIKALATVEKVLALLLGDEAPPHSNPEGGNDEG